MNDEVRRRRVACLVLAAGSSQRMGTANKLLQPAPAGGPPLVRQAVLRALEADLGPVVVVLGHQAEQVADALHGLDRSDTEPGSRLRTVVHAHHRRGMTSSLRAGLRALASEPPSLTAAIVVLADMPRVPTAALRELAELHVATPTAPLVVSRYGTVDAPPTLVIRTLWPEFCALPDHRPPRDVVAAHAEHVVISHRPEGELRDVDRDGDLDP